MAATDGPTDEGNFWTEVGEVSYGGQGTSWTELRYANGCLSLRAERDRATGKVSGSGRAELKTKEDAARFYKQEKFYRPESVEITLSSAGDGLLCLIYLRADGRKYVYSFPDTSSDADAGADVSELGPFYAENVIITCEMIPPSPGTAVPGGGNATRREDDAAMVTFPGEKGCGSFARWPARNVVYYFYFDNGHAAGVKAFRDLAKAEAALRRLTR